MEDGKDVVGVRVDPDPGLDAVVTVGLQGASFEPLLVGAEDVVQGAGEGHEPSTSGGVAKRRLRSGR